MKTDGAVVRFGHVAGVAVHSLLRMRASPPLIHDSGGCAGMTVEARLAFG